MGADAAAELNAKFGILDDAQFSRARARTSNTGPQLSAGLVSRFN